MISNQNNYRPDEFQADHPRHQGEKPLQRQSFSKSRSTCHFSPTKEPAAGSIDQSPREKSSPTQKVEPLSSERQSPVSREFGLSSKTSEAANRQSPPCPELKLPLMKDANELISVQRRERAPANQEYKQYFAPSGDLPGRQSLLALDPEFWPKQASQPFSAQRALPPPFLQQFKRKPKLFRKAHGNMPKRKLQRRAATNILSAEALFNALVCREAEGVRPRIRYIPRRPPKKILRPKILAGQGFTKLLELSTAKEAILKSSKIDLGYFGGGPGALSVATQPSQGAFSSLWTGNSSQSEGLDPRRNLWRQSTASSLITAPQFKEPIRPSSLKGVLSTSGQTEGACSMQAPLVYSGGRVMQLIPIGLVASGSWSVCNGEQQGIGKIPFVCLNQS